MRVLMIANGSD